jgi:hypothetical protein
VTALAEALKSYLTNDSEISAFVSERVYSMRLPEKSTIPAISWHQVSGRDAAPTYDAAEDYSTWISARIQFNCWGRSGDQAMNLGEAVIAALSGYDGSIGGDLIQSSFLVNELDIYEVPTKLYRRILDFQISYEDVPAAS